MNDTRMNESKNVARPKNEPVFTPSADILEKPNELVLSLDLPGVKADAVDIHFERGELTVKASRAAREPKGRTLLTEFGAGGTFYRAFLISQEVATDRISAELKDGVLTVHLPRAEAAQPRKISLKA
jgi:HSP20 family molecular chaperone IbpA